MDNNTTPVQTPPVQPAQQNPIVQPAQTVIAENPKPSGSGTGMKVVMAVVIIALTIAGGAYLYMNNANQSQTGKQAGTQNDQSLNSLDGEINTVVVEGDDDGFTEVDQGLQNL